MMDRKFKPRATRFPHWVDGEAASRRGALTFLLVLAGAAPALSFNPGAKTSAVAETDIAKLKPGEFLWEPTLAPDGPMTVVVNLTVQRAYVYRNGVRIGASTISSGKDGYETPTGVFTILQKDKDHHSNRYNNAAMPYTERLTWDGIALHAGGLPGYPSSHGCVHLPLAFSKALFAETAMGMTVVITDEKPNPQTVINPRLLSPEAGTPTAARLTADETFRWNPQLAATGPVTIVASSADQRMLVLRNGVIIGRSRVEIPLGTISGTHALQLTAFDPEPKWFHIGLPGHEARRGKPMDSLKASRVRIPPEFYADVRAILAVGTTLMVTDGSIIGGGEGTSLTVMASL